ncbi:MAG TPA: hypothetical protein VGM29_16200, partial [Polyangiaceae bacterium]
CDEHAAERLASDARVSWRRVELANPVAAEPRFGWRLRAAGMGLVLGAAAAALLLARAHNGLSYTLQGLQNEHGLLATHDHGGEADFSDQSRLVALPDTSFSVEIAGRHAAHARLIKGALQVSVHHADDTNWSFFAGPYEVRVIGTEFDLSWDPTPARLSISMKKGAVCVLAPDGTVRALKAGESFSLPAPEAPAPLAAAARAPAVADAPLDSVRVSAVAAPKSLAVTASRAAAANLPVSWDTLVAKGSFAEVVSLAEALGVEQALVTRGPADLKAFAQAAHYTGRADLSLRAWSALRERFARSTLAQPSSFFLGRIYEDQGNLAAALKWLSTYSNEAPGGVYAAEALGRRLSLLERLRGKSGATQQAREYLDRFPGGAYAQTARAILDEH